MEYNNICPFCDKMELVALAEERFSDVPLEEDGFDVYQGNHENSDVLLITCLACNKDVPIYHYFNHGDWGNEPCDCNVPLG